MGAAADTSSRFAPHIGRIESFFGNAAGAVTVATRQSAALLQRAQTGQINWNIAGIVLGLIAILIVILQGVS